MPSLWRSSATVPSVLFWLVEPKFDFGSNSNQRKAVSPQSKKILFSESAEASREAAGAVTGGDDIIARPVRTLYYCWTLTDGPL